MSTTAYIDDNQEKKLITQKKQVFENYKQYTEWHDPII